MDLFKVFPPLLLDLLSKFVPGSIFLLVFRNRYLPPTEMVLQLFEPLSTELRSWGAVCVFVISSYLVGVFIALASNAFDGLLNRVIWQPRLKVAPEDYFLSEQKPRNFGNFLVSAKGFVHFVDHSRTVVFTGPPTIAFSLEKYRTAYRFFFALLFLSTMLPFYLWSIQALYLLPAVPALVFLVLVTQKQYVLKSIQLFSIHDQSNKEIRSEAKDEFPSP